jgi:hypothetical protein
MIRASWVLVGFASAGWLAVSCATPASPAPGPVPPPFEPVQAAKAADGAVEVGVWGRRYRFVAGPLPDAIESQGQPLLRRPPSFSAGARRVTWTAPELVSHTAEYALLRSRSAEPELDLRSETRVEYDGMIRVTIDALVSDRDPRIDGFAYEIALPRSAVEFFNHHLLYDYENYAVNKGTLMEAAGRVKDGTRRFAFVPSFSLGGREIGIEWWAETNVHYSGPHARDPIELRASADEVVLRIEPATAAVRPASGTTWRDVFALFPAPMRPEPRDRRSLRLVSQGAAAPRFDTGIGTELVWIAMSSDFPPRWHGLPHSRRDGKQAQMRAALAQRDIRYIPYSKLNVAPDLHPRTMASLERWSSDGRWWRRPEPNELRVFQANREKWKPGDPYTFSVCLAHVDYLDWLLEENMRALREEQTDGLYFDLGSISRMCVRNPVVQGHPDREVWEYFNVRDFYKRLYTQMKAYKPDARMIVHTHGTPRAMGAFMDAHLIGESINVAFSRGHHYSQVIQKPGLFEARYLDHADTWLPAQFFPPVGVTVLLPQVNAGSDPAHPERTRPFQRELYAWALADDVTSMLGNADLSAAVPVLQAIDRFGSMAGVEVHPWWKPGGPVVNASGVVRVTLYQKPKRALAVVANWRDREVTAELAVDAASLGLGEEIEATDLERREDLPFANQKLRVRVPARDFRLVMLEPD